MAERILITGAGVVSAIGLDCAQTLSALLEGRDGIGPVRYLDTRLQDVPLGEVPLSNAELRERLQLSGEELPRSSMMGILAAEQALSQAGIPDVGAIPLLSGTTVGGMDLSERSYPSYAVGHDCGASTHAIAAYFGGFRLVTTLSTACSSAANALMLGARMIRAGRADIVLAGGTECLSDYHLNGFNSLMIVDREKCRPFDECRAGLNLGEGAAFLVLESETSARQRGAQALAVLSGYGNACDAFHQTASSTDGEGAFRSMQAALQAAGLSPQDIDYINAHGTGTPDNDASESAAIRRIFGDTHPPVSSTKAFTGHTTSASGSIEAVICLLALKEGFIPANLRWETPDPACILPQRELLRRPLRHILCNAFGFGGNDSSLIFSQV